MHLVLLPLSLRALFALNGLTVALPQTALLYVVNTRVQIPLEWMPSYAAVAFLPYSLKPCYAFGSSCWSFSSNGSRSGQRDAQIALLLACSGLFGACLALIPAHAIVSFFILSFAASVCSAWPEFLLGLILLDQAALAASSNGDGNNDGDNQDDDDDVVDAAASYSDCLSAFQAQAATARSSGSLAAHILVILFFGILRLCWHCNELNDTTVTVLFVATGILNIVGAFVAWFSKVGHFDDTDTVRRQVVDTDERGDHGEEDKLDDEIMTTLSSSLLDPLLPSSVDENLDIADVQSSYEASSTSSNDHSFGLYLVALLQSSVILLTMRHPITHFTSTLAWELLTSASLLAMIAIAGYSLFFRSSSSSAWCKKRERQYRMGLYLILRNAVPSFAYLMSSFFYTVFAATPSLLQFMALFDTVISTLGCWSYERFWSKYSRDQHILWLVAGTTILASVASIGNICLIQMLDPEKSKVSLGVKIASTFLVNTILGISNEWKFLPDVVLATVSVDYPANGQHPVAVGSHATSENDSHGGFEVVVGEQHETSLVADDDAAMRRKQAAATTSRNLQYGSLVSCIDFGGQLGALLAGPLVALVGTSRDNDWAHLDWLQAISSSLMLCSISLLLIIRH